MPLAALLPTIDNRKYDDIVAEARARIPRYTPEWTDLNESDPGITLVELLAWLTEMQIYRLGQVPELNYLKFLALIGMELLPAASSSVEITFPAEAGATTPSIDVPMGTQVSAEGDDPSTPIIFETDRTLIAVTAPLVAVQAFDGYAYVDRTAANSDATASYQPLGAAAAEAALYLGFDASVPFPPRELDLAVFAPERAASGAMPCEIAGQASRAPARLQWECWNGTSWRPLDLLADDTLALTRSGHVVLRMPPASSIAPLAVGIVTTALRYVRARLTAPTYERAPDVITIRTNTVPATQAVTVRLEIVGGSTGQKEATYTLEHAPILPGTLHLTIDEGDGKNDWEEVEDFFASQKRDRHFVLDRTAGIIRFGDGTNGAIPVANPAMLDSNIVATVYRYGGGAAGNIGAGKAKTLVSSVDGIDANGVSNLFDAAGGRAEETLNEAQIRVPRAIRSRGRAVTADDFEQLAKEVGGIRRAMALPMTHPDFPGIQVPGAVTVVVVPDGTAPNPMPSAGTLRRVCQYLGERRLITTEVYVMPPSYRLVRVAAAVTAQDTADLAAVKRAIEDALGSYFHPLTGGDDGEGWPFGEDIYFSRVFGKASVPGVRSIERLVISIDGTPTDPCTNIGVCDGVLLYSTGHDIAVTYQGG